VDMANPSTSLKPPDAKDWKFAAGFMSAPNAVMHAAKPSAVVIPPSVAMQTQQKNIVPTACLMQSFISKPILMNVKFVFVLEYVSFV